MVEILFLNITTKNKKTVNNVKVVVKMSQYYKIHNARE